MKITIIGLRRLIKEASKDTSINPETLYEEFNASDDGKSAWKKARRKYRRTFDEWDSAQVLVDEFRLWALYEKKMTEAEIEVIDEWMAEAFAAGLS